MKPEDQGYCVGVETISAPVFVLDGSSRIVDVNARFLKVTGFDRKELLGTPGRRFFQPEAIEYPRPIPVAAGGSYVAKDFMPDVVVDIARKDGSVFAARLISTPSTSVAHGAVYLVTLLNTVQLRLDETGFRGMLESAPDATLVLEPEGHIVVANRRAGVLFGLDRDQMDGRNVSCLFSTTYAKDARAWFAERYDAALNGDINGHVSTFPLRALRGNDGHEFPIEVSVSALHLGEGMFLRVAIRDVSERLKLEAGADEMKAHFLATVSHELRTPLASIVGYAELLDDLEDDGLSAQARRFVSVIARNAHRELRLVDDLLTIVSIEGGDIGVRPRSIDLCRVVSESCESLEPLAREAAVSIVLEGPLTEAPMNGDSVRLGQALDNVLDNALKFSPPGGQVTVRVARQDTSLEVVVIDQGPGIPLYERLRVFDRLFRGAQAIADEKAGAGLGLAIAKAIVDAHDGSMSIHCPESGGTEVSLLLPITTEPELTP